MGACLPLLRSADFEPVPLSTGNGGHEGRIAAMIWLGQAKCCAKLPSKTGRNECLPLFLAAEMMKHKEIGEVSHDAVLILQVVRQS